MQICEGESMKNFTLLGVVDLLNKCAIRKDEDLCEDCRYNLLKNNQYTCRKLLCKECGEVCSKIATHLEDDGK